jgi:hypothetical protein
MMNSRGEVVIGHFGDLLQYFRETFGERMHRQHPELPNMSLVKMSATALIKNLNDAGYEIRQSTYNEIETGNTLPRLSNEFINAVCACLDITDPADRQALVQQLAFDVVKRRVSEDIARRTIALKLPAGTKSVYA